MVKAGKNGGGRFVLGSISKLDVEMYTDPVISQVTKEELEGFKKMYVERAVRDVNESKKKKEFPTEAYIMKSLGFEGALSAIGVYGIMNQGKYAKFNDVCKSLEQVMSKADVIRGLHECGEFGLVENFYGDVGEGRVGKLYWMRDGYVIIQPIYEECLMPLQPKDRQIVFNKDNILKFPVA
jgi:hypothetical protein